MTRERGNAGTRKRGNDQTTRVTTRSPEETEALGRRIGSQLRPGDVVALSGDLGTGKTVLAQGIVAGAGASGYVASPTFTFIREYSGAVPVAHVDLYRIDDPRQLDDLGLEDVFSGRMLVIIEWAEKAGDWLPAEHLWITLTFGEKESD
ncbi:MAG: tRNA (adenosine(37)-N6)-threonylcarbamoyltransferase complex ATPase subunit type 1 TsaE, partial [bacterium]